MTKEELLDWRKCDGIIHIPVELLGKYPTENDEKAERFVMNAVGSGMVNAGIHDGDTMVFQTVDTAPNGAIVCAIIDGEVACRRYIKDGKKIRFRREDGITPDRQATEFEIVGILISVVRKFNYCA